MKIEVLVQMLSQLAFEDLSEGSELEDHPCSIAAYKISFYSATLKAISDELNSGSFIEPGRSHLPAELRQRIREALGG